MSTTIAQNSSTALLVFEPQPGATYSLDLTAHLTGVGRRQILIYCKAGLVRPASSDPEGAFYFDDEAIRSIRRIEYLSTVHGINLTGIRMIFELMREVEELREAVEFLRH